LCILVLLLQIPFTWQRIVQLRNDRSQALSLDLIDLKVQFLDFGLTMSGAMGGAESGDSRAQAADLDKLRQSYVAFLDRLVALDRFDRRGLGGVSLLDSSEFEDLKTRAVSVLPLIRGADPALDQILPQVTRELDQMSPVLNSLVDRANSLAAQRAQVIREQILQDLRILAILMASLVAAMALLVWDFRRLYLFNRKQVQENRLANARLETVVATSQDAIIVTDASERITGFNRAAEVMFGMSSSVARGRSIGDLVYESDGTIMSLSRAAAGRTERMQMIGRDAVGNDFPVEMSLGTAIRDGTQIHVCFIRDISDRVEAERALRTSRDRALAGERAKAHFLAVMSHEMRTPLTGILGVIELMRAQKPGANNPEYLDVLQSSGQVLLGQINDVLDLTEIESMGISLNDQPFHLDALLDEVLMSLRPSANRQNSRLMLETMPRPLGWFRGDPIRLRQILINLIGNAIKFTRDGEILIDVTAEPDTQGLVLDRHRIEIQVADTGVGIPQNEMDRIFEDFVRAEQPSTKMTEGTGLGLGIVKRLVAAMGGKLGAESVEGEGSLFWVSLSLKQVEKPSEIGPDTAPDVGMRPCSVLLIEDNATNRFILREMLQRDGHEVAEAADGAQGVEMAAARAFDLILMDINMPVMNGLQATAAIRAGGGKSAGARIVALTAHIFDHEHLRYQDAGIDDILMKPLKWDGLRQVLMGNPAIPLGKSRVEKAADKGIEPPLLDTDILTMLLDTLGPGQLGRLLDQFLSDGRAAITGIKEGLRGERQVLRDRIHGFAGPAATFGARRLHSRLGAIEDKIFDMSDEELRHVPRSIETVWTATRQEVEEFRGLLPRAPAAADLRPKDRLRDANDPRRMI
ncbi:MAG: response regulator, partial [Rhodobacterales bacterium]|nr:response regulator [Rhodobacterales bacterium]